MTNSLLITGSAGFIGTSFVHFWHKHHPGDQIIALDALTYAGNKENLESLLDSQAEKLITFVADRPGHDRPYAINPDKEYNDLGYEPHETFDSGIRKTIDWYLNNESWWRRVMDGSYREWVQRQYGSEPAADK